MILRDCEERNYKLQTEPGPYFIVTQAQSQTE